MILFDFICDFCLIVLRNHIEIYISFLDPLLELDMIFV